MFSVLLFFKIYMVAFALDVIGEYFKRHGLKKITTEDYTNILKQYNVRILGTFSNKFHLDMTDLCDSYGKWMVLEKLSREHLTEEDLFSSLLAHQPDNVPQENESIVQEFNEVFMRTVSQFRTTISSKLENDEMKTDTVMNRLLSKIFIELYYGF